MKYNKYLPFLIFLGLDLLIFVIVFLIFPDFFIKAVPTSQQFSELANSFLHGKLYFLEGSFFDAFKIDNTYFNNHYYWPLGPFPAVLLMPFVLLGNLFNFYFSQEILNFFLVSAIVFILFKLARQLKYSVENSIYLIIAFIFGSVFVGVALKSPSWYFAHTVVVFLLFAALLEYFNKKRFWLIGLLFGLILVTRFTAVLGILFFVFDILFLEKESWKNKIINLLKLGAIPVCCLLLLFSYNYARFNNIFDQGYATQRLGSEFMADKQNYGLFNFTYFTRGLFYSTLRMPIPEFITDTKIIDAPYFKPDPWGMGIFVTSPYLLGLFFMKIRGKKEKLLLTTAAIVWLGLLPVFFIGYYQFGFRYALDFMPLLFLAFMMIYKDNHDKISLGLKIVIAVTAYINLYLLGQML